MVSQVQRSKDIHIIRGGQGTDDTVIFIICDLLRSLHIFDFLIFFLRIIWISGFQDI